MQYIPPFLCQLIDSVAYEGDPQEFREDWEQWKQDYLQYYQRESDYTVSKDDATRVENLPHLLDELQIAVDKAFQGTGQADDLVRYAVEFFTAHDKFYEEREKQYFVANPPLDRLLKASVAYLQGSGSMAAVMNRAPDAALAVDAVQTLFLEARSELPQEMVEGTLDGLRRAQKGFEKLAAHDDEIPREVLEEAIFDLRSAGELLEHLPALFRRFEEEKGSPLPVMGPLVTLLRDGDDPDQIELLSEQAWPGFLDLWESRQDGWLLEPDHCYEILSEADQCILRLSELVPVYPDQEEEFWEVTDRLEEIFFQIKEHTMNLESLPSSPYWPEAQLVLNLLRGGAPVYAAHTIAHSIQQGGDEVPEIMQKLSAHLTRFVRQPEPLPLLQALKDLLDDQEQSKTSRPCLACKKRIPLEAKTCPECGVEVEKLEISG